MVNPVVAKRTIYTIGDPQAPWEDVLMLFMLPGFIIWLIGAIWCLRTNNIGSCILLQVLGAVEIAIGGISAFILSIKDLAGTFELGSDGPYIIAGNIEYYAEIPLIGLIAHFILLAITLTLAILAKRNLMKLQPVS